MMQIHDIEFRFMIQDSRKIKEFTDLFAWKEAHILVLETYKLTVTFPKNEMFGLTDQMHRSVISITSNIAEGFGRQGYREKIHFYYIAHGSLTEYKNQLIIARDLHYIGQNEYVKIESQLIVTHKLIQGLIRRTRSFLNHES